MSKGVDVVANMSVLDNYLERGSYHMGSLCCGHGFLQSCPVLFLSHTSLQQQILDDIYEVCISERIREAKYIPFLHFDWWMWNADC